MCFLLRFPVVGLLADAFIALFAVVLFSAFAILLFFFSSVASCLVLPFVASCSYLSVLSTLGCSVLRWCLVSCRLLRVCFRHLLCMVSHCVLMSLVVIAVLCYPLLSFKGPLPCRLAEASRLIASWAPNEAISASRRVGHVG